MLPVSSFELLFFPRWHYAYVHMHMALPRYVYASFYKKKQANRSRPRVMRYRETYDLGLIVLASIIICFIYYYQFSPNFKGRKKK